MVHFGQVAPVKRGSMVQPPPSSAAAPLPEPPAVPELLPPLAPELFPPLAPEVLPPPLGVPELLPPLVVPLLELWDPDPLPLPVPELGVGPLSDEQSAIATAPTRDATITTECFSIIDIFLGAKDSGSRPTNRIGGRLVARPPLGGSFPHFRP
jgi:hypothetical protein